MRRCWFHYHFGNTLGSVLMTINGLVLSQKKPGISESGLLSALKHWKQRASYSLISKCPSCSTNNHIPHFTELFKMLEFKTNPSAICISLLFFVIAKVFGSCQKKGSRVSESNGTLKGTFCLRNFAQLGSPTKSYCFAHSLDLSNTGESTGPVISALRIRPRFWSPNVFRNLIFLFLSWNKFFMFWSPGGTKSTSYSMRTGSFCFRKPNCH